MSIVTRFTESFGVVPQRSGLVWFLIRDSVRWVNGVRYFWFPVHRNVSKLWWHVTWKSQMCLWRKLAGKKIFALFCESTIEILECYVYVNRPGCCWKKHNQKTQQVGQLSFFISKIIATKVFQGAGLWHHKHESVILFLSEELFHL